VTLSIALSPNPLNVIQGQTGNATLTLSSPAPTGGLTFNTLVDNTTLATVPTTVYVNGGSTSVQVPVTAVSVGDTTLHASAPGVAATATTVSVKPAPAINMGDVTVGKNLQAPLNGTLGSPAPAGNLQITVTSLDPSKFLLATTATASGVPSLTLTVNAGSSAIPALYVQALTDTGTASLQSSAPGYLAHTSTITFQPAGFVLTTASFTTSTFSANTTLTVVAEVLGTGAQQGVRGGFSASVPISSSNTNVGTIVGSLVFGGGDNAETVAFAPVNPGTATITLGTPTGFSTPSSGQQITATVNAAPAITIPDATVGKDLQVLLTGSLAAPAPAGNLQVTITSLDPSKFVLATAPTVPGVASITLTVGAGTSATPGFYVQALADSGTALLQATAPQYATDTSNVIFRPSGFYISSPGNFTTSTFSSPTGISVLAAALNPTTLVPLLSQSLRATLSVDVPIASSSPSVGTIVTNDANHTPIDHVTFVGGDSSKTAAFDPSAGGVATISLTTPTGFSTPSSGEQITATVTAPNINITSVTVGKDLQTTVNITLGAAPPGPVTVTVTSNNGSVATISKSATVDGGTTATFTNVTTTSVGSIVVQGRALGSTTLTVQAPGYNDGTSTVTVNPSGFYIVSPNSFTTTTFSSPTGISVLAAVLNPTTLVPSSNQSLRATLSVDVPIASSSTSVGTIVTNDANHTPIDHVTFVGGDSSKTAAFDPSTSGVATISLTTPTGFSTPSSGEQITATVTAPNINISSVTVGKDLETTVNISLAATPPSPLTLTITSNNGSIATISKSATIDGGTTATFTNVTTTSVGSIVVQGRALGSTTLTVQAPGYNDGTSTVTVNPSGFYIVSPNSFTTTTFSSPTGISILAAVLNPTTLVPSSNQPLRATLSVDVPIASSSPSVGTIVTNDANHTPIDHVTFVGGDSSKTAAFDPSTSGVATISLTTPTGFSTPSSGEQITATVTAPNINISNATVGKDLQTAVNITLGAAPPGPVTVTVTSNNGSIATITTAANRTLEGTTVVTFSNVTTTTVGTIYVQGRALGTTTVTVQASGYLDGSSTVTVNPSGFYLAISSFSTTTTAANSTVTIASAVLNPTTLNVGQQQELRGGLSSVNVPVTSSDPTIGAILGSPAVFSPGVSSINVAFAPTKVGIATISVGTPAGFSTPSNLQAITATVN
jgi:hypothetical protein